MTREPYTVTLSELDFRPFAPGLSVALFGTATFSDRERLRFGFRPAQGDKPDRIALFTMQHGTGVTSTARERITMAAAREAFNARRAEESPLWAFVQRVADINANSNSEPDAMGEALDEIAAAAAALLAGRLDVHAPDAADRATILAALRFYQEKGQGEPFERSDAIHDIATNGGEVVSLDAAGIDDLCERLNR